MGETIDRVEQATIDAINNRLQWPHLGGVAYPSEWMIPPSAQIVTSKQTGYVQHIDVQALGAIATACEIQIFLEILPGSFVHLGMPLARTVSLNKERVDELHSSSEKILACLTVGVRRTFEHDPRFGLSVLSEIASRALSPAVNDPGTAIDVIGRGVRSLTDWGRPPDSTAMIDTDCEQVYLRGLVVDDLFDDFFAPIARDGASLLEVDLRMMKALASLAQINPDVFSSACIRHANLLLKHAATALTLEEDRKKLHEMAQQLVC